MDTTAFNYKAIVFRLKNGAILDTCLPVKKLLGYRSVVIAEHPASEDEECEWNGLHYHGLVETNAKYRFDTDRVFLQIKSEHCEFLKYEPCKLPVNFLAYMQLPPRKIVFRHERDNTSDLALLQSQVTPELISQVKERKLNRMSVKKEGSQDIMVIKDLILKSGAQSEAELLNEYHDNTVFENLYCKRTFTTNFKKSLNFAIQSVLDKNYLDLTRDFEDKKNQCMSPKRSADLMEEWCKFQGIDILTFCRTIVNLMDKQQRKKNTLILEGSPNSGKTFIAKSIEKACIFYGEISQGSSGYAFMWQDCVNKRVIVINEPFFDACMIEQLKIVLEGTGTFVHKKNCSDEYLRPTPVVITSNTPVWNMCVGAKEAIKVRCLSIYDKLKAAPMLKNVRKDLHPRWINLLLMRHDDRKPMPVSPISSDDECSTSRAIDIVAPVLTSEKQTQTEDQSTISTPVVGPTTSAWRKAKLGLTTSLLNAPVKKECSETRLPVLLRAKEEYKTYLEENSCQEEEPEVTTTKRQRSKDDLKLRRVRRRLVFDSDSDVEILDQASEDYFKSSLFPTQCQETEEDQSPWSNPEAEQQLEELQQEEEEDKYRI